MKILVIGSGGREHALVWKIRQSPRVTEVYCAPGNAGTARIATNVPIQAGEIQALADFAESHAIDLTVVGPDDTLAAGVADLFQTRGLKIFGPTRAAARLESSKIFAKEFMLRHGIPTAKAGTFNSPNDALQFLNDVQFPVVVKADGLALGKGVIIAGTREEAAAAVNEMMVARRFGGAGERILIEEFLSGQECSVHALVDGKTAIVFPTAQDHKRAFDRDEGPNTGGMGTYSPPPVVTGEITKRIQERIIEPFLRGLEKDGLRYNGMLFPGLMLTPEGPKVLEFNCRFGDPETQVLLPRLKSDLVDLLEAAVDGKLDTTSPEWDPRTAVCVIMASGGYPGDHKKGIPISGTEDAERHGALIFHAGTAEANGTLVTAGGRVLGVTALAEDLPGARKSAYEAVAKIHFENAHFRSDIGAKGLLAENPA
jgi:phosphoribosylamine--glycine ligase